MSTLASADWPRFVRGLYLTAMAVFLVTIVIGILNGSDAVEFDHNQILTHVHSGTLGWITLTILAAATWYARGIPRPLAIGLAAVIPIYVASFYYANPTLREIVGGVLLVLIVWLVVWAWQVAMARPTLPAGAGLPARRTRTVPVRRHGPSPPGSRDERSRQRRGRLRDLR